MEFYNLQFNRSFFIVNFNTKFNIIINYFYKFGIII